MKTPKPLFSLQNNINNKMSEQQHWMPGHTPKRKQRHGEDEEYENTSFTTWFCCCGIIEWLSVVIDILAVTAAVLYLAQVYNDDFQDLTWENWPAIVELVVAAVILLFVAVPKAFCCLFYCVGGWDPERAG